MFGRDYLVESDDEKAIKMQKQQGNAVNRSPSPLPTAKISSTCLARVRKELGGTQSTRFAFNLNNQK